MEIITTEKEYDEYKNIINFFGERSVCFLDIETTGFNRNTNQIYLIGLSYLNNHNNLIVQQLFCQSLDDEYLILEETIKRIKNFQLIITYNGEKFDIPFINHRLIKNNIEYKIDKKNSFDIFLEIKKYKELLNFENYKLKTIEKYVGLKREDEIDGGKCIEYYYDYLSTKDETLKELILCHNYEDIYNLPYVLEVFNLINKKLSFNIDSITPDPIKISIKEAKIYNDIVYLTCQSNKINYSPIICYENGYNLSWNLESGSLYVKIQINKGLLSNKNICYFIDKNQFPIRIYFNDKTKYNVPENIIIIKEDKKFIVENIKKLTYTILKNSIKKTLKK